jgi:hypothetical protein
VTSRKQQTAAYRQLTFPMGVFGIRNTLNGKVYVDQGLNLPALFNRHRFQLSLGQHPSASLQADWTAFGEAAFVFETLVELAPDKDKPDRDYRADLQALDALWREEHGPAGYPLR